MVRNMLCRFYPDSSVIVTNSIPWVWLTAGAGAKVQPLVTQLPTELKVTEGGF